MKNTIFYASLVAQLFLSGAVIAAPVGGGGGAGGGGGGGSMAPAAAPRTGIIRPTSPITSTSPGTPATPVTPGTGMLQPQAIGNQQQAGQPDTLNTNSVGTMTNGLPNTNGLVGISNNLPVIAPTVNPTNAVIARSTDINGNVVTGDQTVTAGDRLLLTSLGQGLRTSLGIAANGNLPVHFLINNGTVTVVGTTQNPAQSQSILSQIQQTPGVLSVVSDLHVAQPFGTAQTGANASVFGGQTDHAFSPRDQTVLATVQQQAAMQLGINNVAQMPVHFSIQNGVAGVSGQVSSLQEKQALLTAIANTPGIVRVVDNVAVPGAAGMNHPLPATSRGSGTNTIFLNTPNASGF